MMDAASRPSRLEEQCRAVHDALQDPDIAFFFGRKHLAQNTQARRIVWVRDPGTVVAPRQAGPRMVRGGAGEPDYTVTTIFDRIEGVAAYIYTESDDQTDRLLDFVLAAGGEVAKTSFIPGRYEWPAEAPMAAGEVLRSQLCVLHATFRLPVPDKIAKLHPVAAVDHQCGTIGEDGTFTPQPE